MKWKEGTGKNFPGDNDHDDGKQRLEAHMFHREVGRAGEQQCVSELAAMERDYHCKTRKGQQPPVTAVRIAKLERAREGGGREAHRRPLADHSALELGKFVVRKQSPIDSEAPWIDCRCKNREYDPGGRALQSPSGLQAPRREAELQQLLCRIKAQQCDSR